MQQNYLSARLYKLTPWFLALVFIGPWASAHVLYALRDKVTFKTLEKGELLSPPIQTQSLPFFNPSWIGKWQMMYVSPTDCDASCQTSIPQLAQIHRALGKEQHRVQYHVIPEKEVLNSPMHPGNFILIDPKGWLILRYTPHSNPQEILKDIRRLLKYSQVG